MITSHQKKRVVLTTKETLGARDRTDSLTSSTAMVDNARSWKQWRKIVVVIFVALFAFLS